MLQNTIMYEIISYFPPKKNSAEVVNQSDLVPHTVRRLPDGTIFTVGDRVSNGPPMCGKIKSFTAGNESVNNPESKDLTVWTDYSGVGMNLASIVLVPELPSRFQHGSPVKVNLPGFQISHSVVIKVHFANNKIQYDLEVWFKDQRGDCSTRIYNVDEQILESGRG